VTQQSTYMACIQPLLELKLCIDLVWLTKNCPWPSSAENFARAQNVRCCDPPLSLYFSPSLPLPLSLTYKQTLSKFSQHKKRRQTCKFKKFYKLFFIKLFLCETHSSCAIPFDQDGIKRKI
jgi:isocitrate lyase